MVRRYGKPNYQTLTRQIRRFTATSATNLTEAVNISHSSLPKISIVTPSFNQAKFLERTILSVLNQRYPNLEYIIIDGGSTDGSVDIIKKYEPHLSYWVSEPDNGQANAINKGLRLATGDWVGFQNSDDLYLPGAFHKFAKAIEKDNTAEVIYGNMVHIDSDDIVYDVQLTGPAHGWLHLAQGIQFHNQATIWRRALLERAGYLDENFQFCMDFEYFARLVIQHKVKLRHVDELVGAFRSHADSKSRTMLATSAKEHELVITKFGGRGKRGKNSGVYLLSTVLAKSYKGLWYMTHKHSWYLVRHLTPSTRDVK
ncbi:glycosyltransferase family 2 protein [Rubrobacter naiadicus]|uniref:glycosyltransferase family 2 protein n=1 Tax=Rubrobacter naiadicus TaxID=1392641 RepID=UPI0023629E13|nr:glycosyltransferase family 2 protein [Rubrobacter naiadicus]